MKSEKFIDLKLFIFIFIALLFLSANSILARVAISTQNIDAFTFTFLRIFSGAILLLIIYFYKNKNLKLNFKKNWLSSFMLFLYAICFSYSFINMYAGIGTLILFAVVQLSMILIALFYKEKLTSNKIFGVLIAFSGLVYLLYPKEDFSISFFHAFLMIIAGISWGVYSVIGKKSTNATYNTTDNFLKASIFTIIFGVLFVDFFKVDLFTFFIAITSGMITSALGYLIWYEVLPKIEIFTASILQLLVPIIAIFLSLIILDEKVSFELIVSSFIILFGIFIALKKRKV
ncbi:MAG: DMT family transporter [Arcobacter sp.]|uniref:EamA/RhaT family transporter n=1 Tax=Arcobacter defluvii TaxID=873191 RepID=A0AAE7E6Y9_9BACT|nr:DMT family transporter [Arcobacter defluvii]QKF76793.1 EamA/RhaT family transporter [Arcobacter defluvii]RXI34934.1 EamA family transporter [Arcobacter defluvii]